MDMEEIRNSLDDHNFEQGPDDNLDQVDKARFPEKHEAILAMTEDLVSCIKNQRVGGHELRPTQKIAVVAFRDWIREKAGEQILMGYIIHPFGSGKTNEAVLLSQCVPGKTVYIGLRNVEQAKKAFCDHEATFSKDERRSIGACYGSEVELDTDVIVTQFASSHHWDGIDWKSVDLIVVDEADVNALSARRSAFLASLAEKYSIPVVALSATEEQGSGKKMSDVFPDEISRMAIPDALPQALEMGISPPMCFEDLYLNCDLMLHRSDYENRTDYPDEVIAEFVKNNPFIKSIFDDYLNRFRGRKAMMIFRDNAMAKAAVECARALGISAATYTGDLTHAQRLNYQRQMREGNLELLIGSELTGRGLDIPEVEVVYNAKVTRSPQLFWQADGRALRIDENNPDTVVRVIAVLPRTVKNASTGQAVSPEAIPLRHATFFDPGYFCGFEDELTDYGFLQDPRRFHDRFGNRRDLPTIFDLSTPQGAPESIRSIHEVARIHRSLSGQKVDFESRSKILAQIINHLSQELKYGFLTHFLLKMPTRQLKNFHAKLMGHADSDSIWDEEESPAVQRLIDLAESAPSLSYSRETELIALARSGDQSALQLLIHAHLPLMLSIARKLHVDGFDLSDLVNAGVIQLMNRIRDEKPIKGSLVGYVSVSCFSAMTRLVCQQSRDIELKSTRWGTIEAWEKAQKKESTLIRQRIKEGTFEVEPNEFYEQIGIRTALEAMGGVEQIELLRPEKARFDQLMAQRKAILDYLDNYHLCTPYTFKMLSSPGNRKSISDEQLARDMEISVEDIRQALYYQPSHALLAGIRVLNIYDAYLPFRDAIVQLIREEYREGIRPTLHEISNLSPTIFFQRMRQCLASEVTYDDEAHPAHEEDYDVDPMHNRTALVKVLNDVMDDNLTQLEATIIKSHFGLGGDGEEALTLDQLGDIHRLSRDQVRQIVLKAFRKFRALPVKVRLEPFL